MKKCASCTKDLPDAALHCVFCGAKQAPAPAAPNANARTVMGYGGQELEQLRQQAVASNAARAGAPAAAAPAAPPYEPPRPATPSQPPAYGAAPGSYPNPAPGYPPPAASGPAPGYGQGPGPMPMQPAAPHYPSPVHVPMAPAPVQPIAPVPSASSPYGGSQSAARAGRPIEPWKDSLRLMMFIWGGLLLAAFATPLTLEPLAFNWDVVLEAPGKAKLPPLLMAAIGLLAIVLAAIPLAAGARGAIALLLGLAGIVVPTLLAGMPAWQALVSMIGMVVLVPSLLVRHEYRDASLPRVLATLGVLATLVPWVVPISGEVPLVALFEGVIDAPGALKGLMLLVLAQIALLVLALLAWMPAPASGGAKPIAWLLMLWPLVMHVATLLLLGDPSAIEQTPFAATMGWVAGGHGGGGGGGGIAMLGGMGLGVAYLAISSYGAASVLGKQHE